VRRTPTLARRAPQPAAPSPEQLLDVYRRLRERFGPAGWWPARTPLEVCIGAVLVQNTAWTNVEKAIGVLRARGLLEFDRLHALRAARLAPFVRSSGFFRVKSRRLRALLDFLHREYGGEVDRMREEDPLALRAKLLEVPGIGRETADSIVLYAAGLPLFVIDAYTRRVFARLGMIEGDEPYDRLQSLFAAGLPRDAALYNDYHAQVVTLAKDVCRKRPRCESCPLAQVCPRVGL
jgi:endonuclease-3 related protein